MQEPPEVGAIDPREARARRDAAVGALHQPDQERPLEVERGAPLGLGERHVLFVDAVDHARAAREARHAAADAHRQRRRLDASARKRTRLVAIGQGNRERFLHVARQEGCAERVTLLDPMRSIAGHYRAADLLIFPTLYEPFGMVIAEALASGLPAVVSRIAGAAELMRDGFEGFLLDDPADVDQIASAWTRLAADDARRREMGKLARLAVAGRSWDVVAGEHLAVLEPLLRDRSH